MRTKTTTRFTSWFRVCSRRLSYYAVLIGQDASEPITEPLFARDRPSSCWITSIIVTLWAQWDTCGAQGTWMFRAWLNLLDPDALASFSQDTRCRYLLVSRYSQETGINTGRWIFQAHSILPWTAMRSFAVLSSLLFAGLQVQDALASNHFYGITISSFASGGNCRTSCK